MKTEYLYKMTGPSGENSGDVGLNEEEEKIMKALRRLDTLWKKYKGTPGGNRLILFCGAGCTVRYISPSSKSVIQELPNITCDGGDGADIF